MSHEVHEALSDLHYMHRLAARARRWKRAAKHNRRKARWWIKQYFTLREAHVELRGVADRRRQTAAWFARQLAAERSRRRDAETAREAADARQRDVVTKVVTTYMQMFPRFEFVSVEQALAVMAREWREAQRAQTSDE